jgi:hypothetical protein
MPDGPVAVRLDPTNACLWRGAEARRLTPQAGQLVTKETLLATAWPEVVVSEAALVVCIREIRQALGDTARLPQYVETVHRRGYRFIGPLAPPATGPAPPPVAAGPPGVLPAAVRREAELRTLHGWLAQAQGGVRCVGFVTGEAGIGKPTLVDAFEAQATAAGALWVGRGQCVDQYGAGEAYLPVLEALGELCRGPEAPRLLALLAQQAPLWLLQLPAVLRPPARETRHVGQVPIHHGQKTGSGYRRTKADIHKGYLDMPSTPLFAFGHGLSYTTFDYSPLQLASDTVDVSGELRLSLTVTNTGQRRGTEVVQLYASDTATGVTLPAQQLIGFARLDLEPGASKTVAFVVPMSLLAYTGLSGELVMEPGSVEVSAGSNSSDIRSTATFTVTGQTRAISGEDRAFFSVATVA